MTDLPLIDADQLHLAEPTSHQGLTIIPILGEATGPEYLTFRQAHQLGQISITERAGGAEVPELEVWNKGKQAVLILDGEILIGAKQNRTLNTSVLLSPHSRTVLPVSCVEAGRWHPTSDAFGDLDAVVPHRVRRATVDSVRASLTHRGGHRSDQGRVWSEISDELAFHGVHSSTSSMGELFRQRGKDLEAYLQALPCQRGQRGLVAAIGSTVIAADLLSRPEAYAQVHRRLLKGYASEDLDRRSKEASPPTVEQARAFLRRILQGESSRNDGIGQGDEYRFHGPDGQAVALVHEETVVHAVFLSAEDRPRSTRPSDPDDAPIFRRRFGR